MKVSSHYTGTVRRFGAIGAPYEVLEEHADGSAIIRVIETSEETSYPIELVEADPLA